MIVRSFAPALVPALAPALILALAACGGSETAGESGAETATADADSGNEVATIGTIEATINGEAYSFAVPADRGAEEREISGIPSLNLTGMTRQDDGSLGMPYITITVQGGAVAIQNVTIHDGSMMHQLESTSMGGSSVTFDTREAGGPYAGSFSATLERLDADSMPEDAEVLFTGPVEVSGTFSVE
ncbi:hypothetical protein [Aurantiacibacter gilvus]|uniref:Lipoprotein n=1 Tax=Aurantiacibacter gilvus TaxID=3139141 RepID=A0ABU9IFR7_9SPHN